MTIQEAIRRFERHLARRSPRTLQARQTGLNHLLTFMDEQGFAPYSAIGNMSTDRLVECARWLAAKDLADASLANYISTLSVFARFLLMEGIAEFTLADFERMKERLKDLKGRTPPVAAPKVPTDDAIMALQRQAHDLPQHTPRLALVRLRNIALVETLRATGARVAEVAGLRRKDLIPDRKSANVIGKGQKARLIWFDDPAWDAVQTYLALRGDKGENGEPIFARYDRQVKGLQPMSTEAIQDVIRQLSQDAGLEEKVTPHSFRHRFATKVLQATGNLALAQDYLGHASPVTTRIYARITDQELADARQVLGEI
jgi:site-specific recombinase XerD